MPILPQTDNDLRYLLAPDDGILNNLALIPFSEIACSFLNALSAKLLADPYARSYPDLINFAYWCRKANLNNLKSEFTDSHTRLGLGLVFHIAPANVPINFAFSYAFALLAGNSSVVRVSSRDFVQVNLLCNAMKSLIKAPDFKTIGSKIAFVQYPHNEIITGYFSAMCQARIIWGGDITIQNIRKQAVPVRSVDIAFADRYSFCVIDAGSILSLDDRSIKTLSVGFYNDTFLMDQNACSSPHLIVWLGSPTIVTLAKKRFWDSVACYTSENLALQPIHAVDKFNLLCQNAIELENLKSYTPHGNFIYRIEISTLKDNSETFRGKYGTFYEFTTNSLDSISHIINSKYQTMTYFGLDRAQCMDFVIKNQLSGVDRIVPIGNALDIGLIWDGYDIVRSLSRIIDFKSEHKEYNNGRL